MVDELVEGVLAVGPGLAPNDWSGVVVDTGAIFGDVLPVGLHVALRTHTHTHTHTQLDIITECLILVIVYILYQLIV